MSSQLTVRLLVQDGEVPNVPAAVREALSIYPDFPWSYSSHIGQADSTVEIQIEHRRLLANARVAQKEAAIQTLCTTLLDSSYAEALGLLVNNPSGTICPATTEPLTETDRCFAKHFTIALLEQPKAEVSILQDIQESETAFLLRNKEKWIHVFMHTVVVVANALEPVVSAIEAAENTFTPIRSNADVEQLLTMTASGETSGAPARTSSNTPPSAVGAGNNVDGPFSGIQQRFNDMSTEQQIRTTVLALKVSNLIAKTLRGPSQRQLSKLSKASVRQDIVLARDAYFESLTSAISTLGELSVDGPDTNIVQEAIEDLGNTLTKTPSLLIASEKVVDHCCAESAAWGTLGLAGTCVLPWVKLLPWPAALCLVPFWALTGFYTASNLRDLVQAKDINKDIKGLADEMHRIQIFLLLLQYRTSGGIQPGDPQFEDFKELMRTVFSINIDRWSDDAYVRAWLATSTPRLMDKSKELREKIQKCAVLN